MMEQFMADRDAQEAADNLLIPFKMEQGLKPEIFIYGKKLECDKEFDWFQAAIDEKAKREQGPCDYCTGQWSGEDFPPKNPMITVCIVQDTLSVSNDDMAMNYKIAYCPKCGRKLEADK